MSPLHFQLCDNAVCMPIIASEIFQTNLQFYQLSYVILNFIIHVTLKSSVLPENISISFFNYILIIFGSQSLYLNFKKKSLIVSVTLCNPQFYHAYFRWKSSVVSENISTSLFIYILIVFVCWPFYLSFFNQLNLQFYSYLI